MAKRTVARPIRAAVVIACVGALALWACGGTGSIVLPPDALDGSVADGVGSDSAPAIDGGEAGGEGGLTCKSVVDCPPNTVCCGLLVAGQPASVCKWPCGGPDEAQLCDPDAGDSGCPIEAGPCSTATNSDWGLPNGYGTCGGRCPGGC